MLHQLDARTRLRTRVTLQAGLEYLCTIGFLAAYWAVGEVQLSVVLSFVTIAVCNNVLFFGCILSGLSKRFKDPSMTAIQMFASCGRDMFGMLAAPSLWYLFAFNLFVALPFGSLQFSVRTFAVTWLLVCTGLGTMMFLLPRLPPVSLDSTQDRLLLWLFLCAALARLMLFNVRISSLRKKLRNKLSELDAATKQLAALAASNERRRIAGELHDTLLQGVYGLLLRVQAVLDRMPEAPERQALLTAVEQAEALVNEGRERVTGLRAAPVYDMDTTLRQLASELPPQSSPGVSVMTAGPVKYLEPKVCEEMYRIAREALLNVVHHANAQHAELVLRCSRNDARLLVEDDGVGIAPSVIENGGVSGHWGLTGMRERATRIGGTLTIQRRPQGGTRVMLRVPAAAAYQRKAKRDKRR